MNKVRTIFANMSWLMISQIITSVCAFIWTLLTARYLGVSDYGILGTATSFSVIIIVVADLGVTTYITRTIAVDYNVEKEYLGNAIGLKLILSVIYLILTLFISFILGWNNYVILITFLFAIESLIKSFYNLLFASFQAHEMMKYQAITNTLLNVLTLVFIVIICFADFGLIGISFAYILANMIGLIYCVLALTRHIVVPKILFDLSFFRKLIIAGIPFALTTLFYTLYYSIDMVMITQFSTTYSTGLYNSTYKLINVLTLFYTIYSAVIFPVMSKLFKNGKDMLGFSFVKSIKYLSMITIPLAVATFFYAGDVISLCYGNQYADADNVLKILIWTVCFLFINGACSMILNASHKETSVTKIYSIAAVFNAGLNLLLIPYFSAHGAAFATVLTDVLILILEMYMVSKINQLPDKHLIFDLIKIIIASAIMGGVFYLVHMSLWLAIPVGIIVYFLVIILIKFFDNDDKIIIKQILGKV